MLMIKILLTTENFLHAKNVSKLLFDHSTENFNIFYIDQNIKILVSDKYTIKMRKFKLKKKVLRCLISKLVILTFPLSTAPSLPIHC